ncbi:MAG: hypothetical protein QOG23_3120 [Blastocatellia bacterium]|nr:hypothetical protein [Blastocatellia bacterium]
MPSSDCLPQIKTPPDREEAKTAMETLTTFCLEVNAQLSQRPLASLGLDLFANARDLLIVGDPNEVAS